MAGMAKEVQQLGSSIGDKIRVTLEGDMVGSRSFNNILPQPLELEGEWSVRLLDMALYQKTNNKRRTTYICCDVCEDSRVGGRMMPLLHTYHKERLANTIMYDSGESIRVRVRRRYISSIRIYYVDDEGIELPLKPPVLPRVSTCTLLFERSL